MQADFAAISQLRNQSNILDFEGNGNPPQQYQLIFYGLGFAKNDRGEIVITDQHQVLVELGAGLPPPGSQPGVADAHFSPQHFQ